MTSNTDGKKIAKILLQTELADSCSLIVSQKIRKTFFFLISKKTVIVSYIINIYKLHVGIYTYKIRKPTRTCYMDRNVRFEPSCQ